MKEKSLFIVVIVLFLSGCSGKMSSRDAQSITNQMNNISRDINNQSQRSQDRYNYNRQQESNRNNVYKFQQVPRTYY